MKVCMSGILFFCKVNAHDSLATSAVDLDTDRAIQEIIRGPIFRDVTVLTIVYVTRPTSSTISANNDRIGIA